MSSPATLFPGNTVAALILAAGASTRMGTPKALLTARGVSLVAYQVQSYALLGIAPIVVVLGAQGDLIERQLPKRALAVHNQLWPLGQFSSIQRGLWAMPVHIQHVFVSPVDLGPIPAAMLRGLMEARDNAHAAVLPAYRQQTGHPVLLHHRIFSALLKASPSNNLAREISAAGDSCAVEMSTAAIHRNLNTPEEFAAWAQEL